MLLSRYSISIATRFAVVMYCCCPDMNTLILWQQQNYYIRIYMSLYKYVMLLLRYCCCNICTLQNRKYSNVNVFTSLCRWYDLIRYSCYMYEKQYHCFNNTITFTCLNVYCIDVRSILSIVFEFLKFLKVCQRS